MGDSVYGCHDLSGNVWEWTRSASGYYPYPAVGTPQWRTRTEGESAVCVSRGGAFYNNLWFVPCAVRRYGRRDNRDSSVGFRCCVVPITLFSENSGR
ncbi:MAG: SUMF1/EgtB/PvdO family nonheme iron enzyme [Gammaproteobacteria bacterium]